VFDPFGDFESRGYLQNFEGLKRLDEVKVLEHTFFEANLEDAFEFLGTVKGALTYKHFLKVHHVLFSDFYPWAGQDRLQLGVGQFVEKGNKLVVSDKNDIWYKVEWQGQTSWINEKNILLIEN
jgi:cell filamentation protein